MKKLIIITLLSLCNFVFSQDKGTISGTITDKEMNGEPLPFANVFIKGTSIGGTSDMDGKYSLNVPLGNQTLVFSFIGYKTIEKNIIVKLNQPVIINQELGANEGVALDEVEIKATINKEKSSALLLDQKKAVIIKESIGAEELSSKGISNAAGAVAKISGVSKQEGSSNVYVRGLGDRYLNTTLNGLSLPSNNISKKNIDLNLFPSDIIQNVSISKAYSSNFYGDFAAGNINVSSKEYNGRGFAELSIGSGINSRAMGEDFKKSEGTGNFGYYNRFKHNPFSVVISHGVDPINTGTPINNSISFNAGKSFDFKNGTRLSLFGTASFDRNFEYREGPIADFSNVFKKEFPNAKEYKYSTSTTAMISALYRLNSENKIKYTSLFLNNSSDEVGYYGFKGLGKNRDALRNTDKGFYQMNVQYNQDLVFVNQLTGEHKFDNDELKVSWGIGYNNVFAHEPDRKRVSIENFQNILDNDPNTNAVFYTNNSFDNQRYFQKIIDEELNSRVSIAYKANENVTYNFGYNGRTKERNFKNIRYGYDILNQQYTVKDPNNLNEVFNINNAQIFRNQTNKIFKLDVFRQLPGFQNSNIVSLPGLNENTYNGQLNIHAGFASAEIKFGEKWMLVPGVRAESFNQEISYEVININPNDPGKRSASETFFLPNLNVKYALKNNQNIRFNFSQTVSVPEFKEVAPFIYEGIGQRVGGNPDLLNNPSYSKIFNLDLKYEWFISKDELMSVAIFGKQINDPVNLVIANSAAGDQRYFRSGNKANVAGIELELRKNLVKDENDISVLSTGFNFTYMYTNQDLKENVSGISGYSTNFNRKSDELQGASPFLINANINYTPTHYKNYTPITSLVFSYFSDRIDALGAGSLGNIIEKGVPNLDFVWKNKFGDKWDITLKAKNILDPSIKRVREKTPIGDVVLSQYKRGTNISLGLKYKF
ncbi:TonB-dependent receptor domain-containing protein [Tenacibaculum aestuariivivum]|uniref:TonB-dependent receptor n=1 Tax=Tenacibaculum aestuariivivum TaxID=2006131 RepID=UPI003AB2789E